jgi:hypothetical protein
LLYGGGININCFEEDIGCKGVVVGGGRVTICINNLTAKSVLAGKKSYFLVGRYVICT